MPLDLQFYTLSVMILTGVAAGLVLDVFRSLRKVTGARGLARELWDLLFWLVLTVVVAAGLVVGTWGRLRLIVLLGGVVGLWLYLELASDIVFVYAEQLLGLAFRMGRALLEFAVAVLLLPLELFILVVEWTAEAVLFVLRPTGTLLKWLLEPVWRRVYPRFETELGYYRHLLGPYLYLLRRLFR
jgi:spore cortex biosynthesis protein YabQ